MDDGQGQEWTMDGMDKNGLLNGQWTMDNGQEWTRTAGDIFILLSSNFLFSDFSGNLK